MQEMLLISNVEVRRVERNPVMVDHWSPMPAPVYKALDEGMDVPFQDVRQELVEIRRYRDVYGKEVFLGMTSEVQELLRLPYEAYQEAGLERDKAEDKIKKIKKMTFWQRLKFLFTGKLGI
jgi:hypothetical protein